MYRLYIALAALLGGLASALAGWLDSGEPFNARKLGGSVIRSLVAGLIFAAGYQVTGSAGVMDLFYAFLGGAGVDVLGNRISGKLGNGSFPLSLPGKPPQDKGAEAPREG